MPKARRAPSRKASATPQDILRLVLASLEDDQAEEACVIDLAGRAAFADYMVIASGRSTRHIGAVGQHLLERFKAAGHTGALREGSGVAGWLLLDLGDVVVHIFHPEQRRYYALEEMWQQEF